MEIRLLGLQYLYGRRISSYNSYPMAEDGKRAEGLQQNSGRGGYAYSEIFNLLLVLQL